jgi:hypothetical protein
MEVDIMSSEQQKARMRAFFQNNRDRYAYYGAHYRDGLKLEMVAAYGGMCEWCEETDPIVLTLDHKDDDSHIEKGLYGLNARGGHKLYSRLKQEGWPRERFQLLCFNCNAKKEHYRKRDEMAERWGTEEEIAARPKRAGEGVRVSNRSGFKGVFWNSQKHRWQAKITLNGKGITLGFYKDLALAALAYRKAAIEAWGEYANVPTLDEIAEIAAQMESPQASDKSAEDLGL